MSEGKSNHQKSSKKSSKLAPHIEEIRTRVFVDNKSVDHAKNIEDPDAFPGYDNAFSLEHFKDNFKIEIVQMKDDLLVFDMIGVDAPVANAFRRILLSEVPTMAIDKVLLFQNTSIVQDEVLVHRLGLIPIKADSRQFKFVSESKDVVNEENTTVFTLEVACSRNPAAPATAPISDQYINSTVLSSDLVWVPQGQQAQKFADNPIRPVNDDIVIAKLRPGQVIEAELHVEKGIGRTHAKWSPVATASYRLMPEINFVEPVTGKLAEEVVKRCPMNVYDIEDIGGGKTQAVASRPRSCTMCRECIRDEELDRKIQLRRVRDHFIFSIETTGAGPSTAAEVFKEACKVFTAKCNTVLQELARPNSSSSSSSSSSEAETEITLEDE